jgi:hypothetical protein
MLLIAQKFRYNGNILLENKSIDELRIILNETKSSIFMFRQKQFAYLLV